MLPFIWWICHTALYVSYFGTALFCSLQPHGPVVALVWNVHWMKDFSRRSQFPVSPQRSSPASQPPTLRRQAGEIPAWNHCLKMDTVSADRFFAELWHISLLYCSAHLITLWKILNIQIVIYSLLQSGGKAKMWEMIRAGHEEEGSCIIPALDHSYLLLLVADLSNSPASTSQIWLKNKNQKLTLCFLL